MGDSASKYYEMRDDYRELCKELNVKPQDDFYKHREELYEMQRIITTRDKKIEEILSITKR